MYTLRYYSFIVIWVYADTFTLQIKCVLTELGVSQFILMKVGPTPYLSIYNMRKTFSSSHLLLEKDKIKTVTEYENCSIVDTIWGVQVSSDQIFIIDILERFRCIMHSLMTIIIIVVLKYYCFHLIRYATTIIIIIIIQIKSCIDSTAITSCVPFGQSDN